MGRDFLLDIAGGADVPEVDRTGLDCVAGDGHALDPWWQDREVDGLCAPTSAAIAHSYITGELVDKDAVTDAALGWGC